MAVSQFKEKFKLKGTPNQGLAAATFGFFVGFAAVALIGPVGVKFQQAMGLSAGLLGLLVAAPQLSGSLLRIPFGAWVDKTGGKRPLLILLSLSIVGLAGMTYILFAYYPSGLTIGMYPIVLLFVVLCGSGVATFSVGIPQTSYWFPQKRQGWALGVFAGLGNTAPGFFTLILPFALVSLGLSNSYASWFLFVVIGTVVYALIAHDAPYFQLTKSGLTREKTIEVAKQTGEELIPTGKLVDALKVSARNWRNWALVALYFTSFGGFLALTTWLPTYWGLFYGLDVRSAAVLTALGFSLLASFLRVLGGRISDKYGGENIALISFILILAGAIVLVTLESFISDVVGELILGAGMGTANAAVFKLVARYVPEAVGGASGWVGGLGAFGGFVVPPILGAFVDILGKEGYALGFSVYILLALMAIAITFALRIRQPKLLRTRA